MSTKREDSANAPEIEVLGRGRLDARTGAEKDGLSPSLRALISSLSAMLGPTVRKTQKVAAWNCNGFEVVVQLDTGPHVWLPSVGAPPTDLPYKDYPANAPRHSNVKASKSLGVGRAARRIEFVGGDVERTVEYVRKCAIQRKAIRETAAQQRR